jgi:hypothetical protein
MGYSTNFEGELKFKNELTIKGLSFLSKFLGQDRRDIGFENDNDVYVSEDEYWYHIDLELLKDFSGLKWNGAEKTYGLPEMINFITKQMKDNGFSNFELTGELNAQGEDIGDVWKVVLKDGKASKKEMILEGKRVTCPHCEEDFILKGGL